MLLNISCINKPTCTWCMLFLGVNSVCTAMLLILLNLLNERSQTGPFWDEMSPKWLYLRTLLLMPSPSKLQSTSNVYVISDIHPQHRAVGVGKMALHLGMEPCMEPWSCQIISTSTSESNIHSQRAKAGVLTTTCTVPPPRPRKAAALSPSLL